MIPGSTHLIRTIINPYQEQFTIVNITTNI